jgi:hypothetical protein
MKPSEQVTAEQIDKLLRGIDPSKLGDWEQKFVTSVREYWGKSRRLSEKQSKRLVEIWKRQQNAKPPLPAA